MSLLHVVEEDANGALHLVRGVTGAACVALLAARLHGTLIHETCVCCSDDSYSPLLVALHQGSYAQASSSAARGRARTRQSRSHSFWPERREQQKSSGLLHPYCRSVPIRGASGSAGGHQFPSSSPHSSSAALRAFTHSAKELHSSRICCKWTRAAGWFARGSAPKG